MDKKTKIKVTLITIAGVVVALLYFNRGQIINDLKRGQIESEWAKSEPQGQLVNGRKNGEWKAFFKDGQIASIQNYKNDTLDGKQINFTPAGHYNSRANYKMGMLVDSFLLYHSNGGVNLEEFKDLNGKDQGVFKVYHDNGKLSQVGQKIDGQFDGEFKTFYKSGQLKDVEYYVLGKKTGTWIWLSENGDTTKIESY